MLLDQPDTLKTRFDSARPYAEFLASAAAAGAPVANWPERHAQCALRPDQAAVVSGFVRKMHVLCLTGSWCGDCALQGAAMQRVAEANPEAIDLRFLLRDDSQAELAVRAPVNGGLRVPFTWWLAEDFAPVHAFGDRTLSRYRSMARKALGDAVVVPSPPPADPVLAVRDEVLAMFERVHLLLRTSGRLRQAHGD